jgi:hypothetical protein
MARTYGDVRKKFFTVFLGLIFFGAGYALSAEFLKEAFPVGTPRDYYELFQVSVVVIGQVLMAFGFAGVPSLAEIKWRDFLVHVYVFHIDTSVCMYDETLLEKKISKSKEDTPDEVPADLFSSGVTGIIGLIKEMINSEKKLKILDHEDKKLILEYGEDITVALLTFKDLHAYRYKLDEYVEEIEQRYDKDFQNWTGEVSKFNKGIYDITEHIFKEKVDLNWWKVKPENIIKRVKEFFSTTEEK